MRVIPALQIEAGSCVTGAAYTAPEERFLDEEPSSVARRLEAQGAAAIHLVDGDGVRAGRLVSFLDLIDVLMAVAVPVQVEAGLRASEEIAEVLSRGAAAAVVDVDAVSQEHLERAMDLFGPRLVPSISLATDPERLGAVVERSRRAGAARVLCVDRARAGTLAGPAMDRFGRAASFGLPILASGGIGSAAHIRALARVPGVEGVVVHRAVAEHRLLLPEAIRAADLGPEPGTAGVE
ncbi:MAG: HisA/HisF-related TIM barrel protein [Acidobacteriota bacterium]